MTSTSVTVSPRTFLLTASYLFGFWFLYQVRSILITIFIAFIFMTAIRPLTKLAARIRIPSLVVVLTLFLLFMSLTTTLVASLIPAFLTETKNLIHNLPQYLLLLHDQWGITVDPQLLSDQLNSIPSNILSFAAGAFGNIITIMAVFFMTYYLLLERPHLHHYLTRFFGKTDGEQKSEAFLHEVELRVGGWVRGELLLMLIIGVMTYFGLLLLGIPYVIPLAVMAGLLEAVPNLGPTIAAIPAILLGLTISPITALGALAMSILIQQLENNLIVPKVMQATTGVMPLITIIVLMIGFTLGGIVGAVLAMPVYLAIHTLYKHLHN
jgi:predicted PurR-regulated permease PerM